ncbi:hypothetical protein AB0H36_45615 [Kribbella sp. NPDC050820]|uniref:hypothetical protein n=1 Tax=Kribbella sp. NPDC050820 TaxID=3155408 RepID=UPI0033DE0522
MRGGWGGDGRGDLVLEAAQHLHPYPRGLTLDDPSQQPVLLGDRQAGHPVGDISRIVGDLLDWRGGLGCDREQVFIEAEEVGQCSLCRGERAEPGRDWWFEIVVGVEFEDLLVRFPGAVGGQPREVEWPQITRGEFGTNADDC